MSEPFEWDQAEPYGVAYKQIDTSFLAPMDGGFCNEEHVDSWGRVHGCRYPVAVWS